VWEIEGLHSCDSFGRNTLEERTTCIIRIKKCGALEEGKEKQLFRKVAVNFYQTTRRYIPECVKDQDTLISYKLGQV
jgi:hypothetical protein